MSRPSGIYRIDRKITITVFHGRSGGWFTASVYQGRNRVCRSGRWLRRRDAVRQAVRMFRAVKRPGRVIMGKAFEHGEKVRVSLPGYLLRNNQPWRGRGIIKGLPSDNGGFYYVQPDVSMPDLDFQAGVLCTVDELEAL